MITFNVHVQSARERTAEHKFPMPKPVITFVFQSATEWTASVHNIHMPKPVITFVFKVLRSGLPRYIIYKYPNL